MPVLKQTTIVSDNGAGDRTLGAGGGPTIENSVATTTGWHKTMHIKFTNGATGPTTAAKVEIQGSPDNTNWYTVTGFRATTPTLQLSGGTGSNEVKSYSVLIPSAVQYLRLVWTHGDTGSNITVRGEFSEVEEMPNPPPTIKFGTTSLPTATSAVVLTGTSTPLVQAVVVESLSTNTGKIYVGDNTVTTSNGFELLAGESLTVLIDDANKVYVVSDTNSQTVRWFGT